LDYQNRLQFLGELKAILQREVVSYELASTSSDVVDISLGRILPKQQDDEKKTLLVFIGTENSPLLSIWLMTFPKVGEYVHYAPDLKSLTHER
jgi:hypothetical protein